jgi:hypothetical protein
VRETSKEGLVSKRAKGVVMLAVSLSVVWLVFILYGSPWVGLMWVVSLAFAAALWASRRGPRPGRSIGQVIADLDSEPVPAVAVAMDAGPPAHKAVL